MRPVRKSRSKKSKSSPSQLKVNRQPLPVNRLAQMILDALSKIDEVGPSVAKTEEPVLLRPAPVSGSSRLAPLFSAQLRALRRCHRCGCVGECMGARIERCPGCGKTFAPFFYVGEYGDGSIAESAPSDQSHSSHRAISGLTVGWYEGPEALDPDLSSKRLESRFYS